MRSGSTGILVGAEEPPDRFATALLWLIDQSDERRRMAEAARAYAVGQSWEAIMGSLRGAIKASSASRPNWRAGPDQASDARSTPYSQPTRMESGHARASLFLVARGRARSQWTLLANSGP